MHHELAHHRHPPPAGRVARPLAVLLLFAALAAPSAHAGSYVVVGCADLAGALGPAHAVRPAEGWYLAAGVYPSRDDCARVAPARPLRHRRASAEPLPLRRPARARRSRGFTSTYRAHLSGAAPWAVPTFVVEAGHGGALGVHRARRAATSAPHPIELGGRPSPVGDAHDADALRIGVRCELAGPCVEGGQPCGALPRARGDAHRRARAAVGVTAPGGHLRGSVERRRRRRATRAAACSSARSTSTAGRSRMRGSAPTVPASVGAQRHVTGRVPCPLDAPARDPLRQRARSPTAPHTPGRTRGGRRGQRPHRRGARSSSTTCRRARARVDAQGRRVRGAHRAGERVQRRGRRRTTTAGSAATRHGRLHRRSAARSRAPTRSARRRGPSRPRGRRRDRRRRHRARGVGAERARHRAGHRPRRRALRRDAAARAPDRLARAGPPAPAPHDGQLARARPDPRPAHRPRAAARSPRTPVRMLERIDGPLARRSPACAPAATGA